MNRLDRFLREALVMPHVRGRFPLLIANVLREVDPVLRWERIQLVDPYELPWSRVITADDPGNPGRKLHLCTLAYARIPGQFVFAHNGTPPHALHLIPVSNRAIDPVAAVAATYGLTAAQYAGTAART